MRWWVCVATVRGTADPWFWRRGRERSASWPTVFARAISLFIGLYVLHYRDNMLTFKSPGIREVLNSWKNLLSIALPAAGARLIVPIAIGIVTHLIASYGAAPVAAYGAASRAEFFMLAILMALSSVLNPFVGQNIGANKVSRAKEALNKGMRFALLWGVGSFLVLLIIARPVARLFSTETEVIEYIVLYLHIVPIGYALRGVFDIVVNVLYVLRKPLLSALLILMQMIILIVPLIYLGSYFYGIKGIFIGMVVANIISGSIGYLVLKYQLKNPITGA